MRYSVFLTVAFTCAPRNRVDGEAMRRPPQIENESGLADVASPL